MLDLESEDGPRVGIPKNALILYSMLIVIKVVGCVLIHCTHLMCAFFTASRKSVVVEVVP